jgi:hypothetical protein
MKTFYLAPIFSALLASAAFAQSPSDPSAGAASRTLPVASARDGFTLRGTEPVMTREGVTTKVEREVRLPNGLRVLPDGSVTMRDGSTTTLRPNQLLTFEGVFYEVALTPDGVAPLSSVTTAPVPAGDVGISARDGVTVSGGEAFLTRNGVMEKVTAEVRMPNGVAIQPDGMVVMSNGNRVPLRANQILGLDGVVREAPVRPNPAGPAPALSNPR